MLGYCRLFVEQGAEVAAFFTQGQRIAVELRHEFVGIVWWLFLRATEQIALQQVDAHLRQYDELFFQLDAFGDHLGA
ncbi:hypothetical protein D3C72_2375930 [compost metagenome]